MLQNLNLNPADIFIVLTAISVFGQLLFGSVEPAQDE